MKPEDAGLATFIAAVIMTPVAVGIAWGTAAGVATFGIMLFVTLFPRRF